MNKGKSYSHRPFNDDRKGLGYGQLEPAYHVPKVYHNEFPYITPDTHEEDGEAISGDDIDAFVQKINMGYHITDFMSDRKNDPHYFVAGNDKLSEATMTNNLVPLPDLYTGRETALGGTSLPGQANTGMPTRSGPTGSKLGWTRPARGTADNNEPVYQIKDLPDQEELDNRNITDLRKLISAIFREQELEAGLS